MRLDKVAWLTAGVLLASISGASDAFLLPATNNNNRISRRTDIHEASADCGCDTKVIRSGKITPQTQAINARQVIGQHSIKDSMGHDISMEEMLTSGTDGEGVSIVVFLRFLG